MYGTGAGDTHEKAHMAFIHWNNRYSIGVEFIDRQHQILFETANTLYDAILQKQKKEILSELFVNLVEYTSSHFSEEENDMMLHRYPDYPIHKMEHDALRDEVMRLFDQLGSTGNALSITIMDSIQDWLRKHILEQDMKYASHLRGGQLIGQ